MILFKKNWSVSCVQMATLKWATPLYSNKVVFSIITINIIITIIYFIYLAGLTMFYNIFLRPINQLSFFSTVLCHSNLLLPILFPACSLKHHQSMWFLAFLFFFFQVEPILILFSEIYLLSFSLHGRTILIVYSLWNLLLNFNIHILFNYTFLFYLFLKFLLNASKNPLNNIYVYEKKYNEQRIFIHKIFTI